MENIFSADETMEQIEQDGAAQAESNPQSDVVGLAEALASEDHPEDQPAEKTEEAPAEKAVTEEAPQPAKEPAWYRRQLNAERTKWNRERADYEAKLAAYAEKDLEAEAEKLAASENISKNIALRILRAERGMPAQASKPEAEKPAPQRDANGRFVKAEPEQESAEDPARARAQELIAQNEILVKTTGVNALELYNTNPKVAQKVNSGEWDFTDVVKAYMEETGGRRVPAPVRSANGASVMGKSINDLSDKEWEALNRKLDMGYVIDPGR